MNRTPPRPAQSRRKPNPSMSYRRKSNDAATVGLGCLALLILFPIILAITALVFLLAWNVGVVALVAAAGGSVSKIGFWTAVGGALAVGILSSIFGGNRAQVKS